MRQNIISTFAITSLFILVLLTTPASGSLQLQGSGASFPHQIYSLWFMFFSRNDGNTKVEYEAKGSGGGILDFQNHKVDFAASDAAMNDEEISKVNEGVQLLPMTAGEVVLGYNLNGIMGLKLPRSVYPKIFLGKITKWNDKEIAEANPGVTLPDLDITIVTRVDSSGTNYVFTKHLSAISEEFRNGPGVGKKVAWPAAAKMKKVPLNIGVISTIKKTPGAIGYVDYGYADMVHLDMAILENRAGKFVAPGPEGGQAALSQVDLPPNLIAWLPDPAGEKSYPITTYTWMMFYKKYQDPTKAEALRRMIAYCLDEGQKISDRFGYIPLPKNVAEKVREAARQIN